MYVKHSQRELVSMRVHRESALRDYASQHRGRERVDGRQTESLSWIV